MMNLDHHNKNQEHLNAFPVPMTVKPICRQARRKVCKHCRDGVHCCIRSQFLYKTICAYAPDRRIYQTPSRRACERRARLKRMVE